MPDRALGEFTLHWADDKLIVGQQLAGITGFYGPDLEENLALGSLAQDHLGHARTLYLLIAPTDREIDRLVFLRDPSAYRTSLLASAWETENWAFISTRGLLYSHAEHVRAQAVAKAPQPWGGIAATILRDEAVHLDHWKEWLAKLARQPAGRARIQTEVDALFALAGEFFDPTAWHDGGIALCAAPIEAGKLLALWHERTTADLQGLGLRTPLDLDALARQADALAARGLCGRRGRHHAAFGELLAEAGAIYRSDPSVQWG